MMTPQPWLLSTLRGIAGLNEERPRDSVNVMLGVVVEVVTDPAEPAQFIADVIESNRQQPTGWMQRLRSTGRAGGLRASKSGTPQFLGRTCCLVHLEKYGARVTQAMPLETTPCPGCGRVFRFRIGASVR